MYDSPHANFTRDKISADFLMDLAVIKGHLKHHLINLEKDDEENGLLTVYCFNEDKFILSSMVTRSDYPTISLEAGDIESSIFQALNPELFAGLEKINKVKQLNQHAHLVQVNAQGTIVGGDDISYILEMIFDMKNNIHFEN